MEVLGQIIGYGIVVFTIIVIVVAFRALWRCDLDGPIFKTDIKITIKEEVDEDVDDRR